MGADWCVTSTLFAVCVIQIKPQLEKLLRLVPDSLTKEIRLTQVRSSRGGWCEGALTRARRICCKSSSSIRSRATCCRMAAPTRPAKRRGWRA